jgi:hypothetical protein
MTVLVYMVTGYCIVNARLNPLLMADERTDDTHNPTDA